MQKLEQQQGTWRLGLLYLLLLAPFFFLSYGFANHYAAHLPLVSSIVFDWEKYIPLWPWTIVPYWSIDLFYGLSLLLCWNKFELKQHALRLFTAQVISVSCFLLFPLKFSFERPELTGFFGVWFDLLMGFDRPFNQAPSLHIVLLVILWDFYRRHAIPSLKWIVDSWSFLIGLSVLTTWQHHFIDIPTGIIVGALCLWLFPLTTQAPYKSSNRQKRTSKHLKLVGYYLTGALLLSLIAGVCKGWGLWLFYPALSLLLVAFSYYFVRPYFFQKQLDGSMSIATLLLFAPYLLFAHLNSRLWTKDHPNDSLILKHESFELYLGRIPSVKHTHEYDALFDCCAELPTSSSVLYQQYLSLDLIPLESNQLAEAVALFDDLIGQSIIILNGRPTKILIFCALGYSRSTAILCAWLLKKQYALDVQSALKIIQQARPWVQLSQTHIHYLETYQREFLLETVQC